MKIATDKLLHGLACFFISVIVFAVLFAFGWRGWATAVAFLLTAAVAAGKELYDKFHPDSHSAEWGDVIADGVGAFLALAAQLTIILTI